MLVQRITIQVCRTEAIPGLCKLSLTGAFVSYLDLVIELEADYKSAQARDKEAFSHFNGVISRFTVLFIDLIA